MVICSSRITSSGVSLLLGSRWHADFICSEEPSVHRAAVVLSRWDRKTHTSRTLMKSPNSHQFPCELIPFRTSKDPPHSFPSLLLPLSSSLRFSLFKLSSSTSTLVLTYRQDESHRPISQHGQASGPSAGHHAFPPRHRGTEPSLRSSCLSSPHDQVSLPRLFPRSSSLLSVELTKRYSPFLTMCTGIADSAESKPEASCLG